MTTVSVDKAKLPLSWDIRRHQKLVLQGFLANFSLFINVIMTTVSVYKAKIPLSWDIRRHQKLISVTGISAVFFIVYYNVIMTTVSVDKAKLSLSWDIKRYQKLVLQGFLPYFSLFSLLTLS
jgi:hypothetical protein